MKATKRLPAIPDTTETALASIAQESGIPVSELRNLALAFLIDECLDPDSGRTIPERCAKVSLLRAAGGRSEGLRALQGSLALGAYLKAGRFDQLGSTTVRQIAALAAGGHARNAR